MVHNGTSSSYRSVDFVLVGLALCHSSAFGSSVFSLCIFGLRDAICIYFLLHSGQRPQGMQGGTFLSQSPSPEMGGWRQEGYIVKWLLYLYVFCSIHSKTVHQVDDLCSPENHKGKGKGGPYSEGA